MTTGAHIEQTTIYTHMYLQSKVFFHPSPVVSRLIRKRQETNHKQGKNKKTGITIRDKTVLIVFVGSVCRNELKLMQDGELGKINSFSF